MPAQLPLRFRWRSGQTFDTLVPGPNAEAIAALRALRETPSLRLVYLWGAPGSGRTHLLEACCAHHAARAGSVAWVPMEAHRDLSPAMLDGLARQDLICLDDVDRIAGEPRWEEALFALYNEVDASRGALVVSARTPPARAGFALADLTSRLGSGLVLQVRPLEESDRRAVLRSTAGQRGLELPDDVLDYLMTRFNRELPALLALLDRLDARALAAQRRLTVPFVRGVLTEGARAGQGEPSPCAMAPGRSG